MTSGTPPGTPPSGTEFRALIVVSAALAFSSDDDAWPSAKASIGAAVRAHVHAARYLAVDY